MRPKQAEKCFWEDVNGLPGKQQDVRLYYKNETG